MGFFIFGTALLIFCNGPKKNSDALLKQTKNNELDC